MQTHRCMYKHLDYPLILRKTLGKGFEVEPLCSEVKYEIKIHHKWISFLINHTHFLVNHTAERKVMNCSISEWLWIQKSSWESANPPSSFSLSIMTQNEYFYKFRFSSMWRFFHFYARIGWIIKKLWSKSFHSFSEM